MAKKKKGPSIVSSDFRSLPDPDEAKRRTGEAVDKIDPKENQGRGRPKSTHGLKRTSVMLDDAKMQRLKILAIKQDRYLYELIDEAIAAYLKANE